LHILRSGGLGIPSEIGDIDSKSAVTQELENSRSEGFTSRVTR
jgi:hypothetical protein